MAVAARAALAIVLALSLGLAACAGVAMAPGGGDAANRESFASVEELKTRAAALRPGMGEDEVFAKLGRSREQFAVLDPEDAWHVALARGVSRNGEEPLTAYRLHYRQVMRRHGLSSPISIRTDETGYSYDLTLLFRGGRLIDRPVLSGGTVNEVQSRTLFDYVTPGSALGYVKR